MKFSRLYKLLYEQELLLENFAAKPEKYFNRIFQVGDNFRKPDKDQLMSLIIRAIDVLKVEPRVSIFLKEFAEEYRGVDHHHNRDMFVKGAIQDFGRRLTEFEHFYNLNVSSINNYNWTGKFIQEIIGDFREMEARWKKDRKEWIDITEDMKAENSWILHDFGDGFVWMVLERSYCREEGNAMGHCGTAYGGKLMSLRRIKKEGGKLLARPSLTFHLTDQHFLGEMKGRGNEKPNEKYHSYIVGLLQKRHTISSTGETNWFIKGIRGGGYNAESNFSLNDLSPELSEEIYKTRRDLIPIYTLVEKEGLTPQIQEDIKKFISGDPNVTDVHVSIDKLKKININFLAWKNVTDLLEYVPERAMPKNIKLYKEYVLEDKFWGDDWNSSSNKEANQDLLQTFLNKHPEYKPALMQHIIDNYSDVGEDYDNFPNLSPKDTYRILSDNDDELIDILGQAYDDGYRTGSESQMHEAFYSGIEDLVFHTSIDGSGDGFFYHVGYEDSKHRYDSPLRCYIDDANELLADFHLTEQNEFELGLMSPDEIDKDMDVPYYGFDDYDEESALSYLHEHITIEPPKTPPPKKRGKSK